MFDARCETSPFASYYCDLLSLIGKELSRFGTHLVVISVVFEDVVDFIKIVKFRLNCHF